ncbi:hypothetical protein [Rhodoflexus caldus]|uniref:hypothetical protein n=1 Tax=Rhodoflexus caldus TaxID=2891236 RepID=UPI00202A1F61|nr:hypothetical protein [Rhodoflexus caldus]
MNNQTLLYQSPSGNIEILLQESPRVIIYRMKGRIELDEYKAGFEEAFAVNKRTGCFDIIYDYSALEYDPALGRAWFTGIYAPRILRQADKTYRCIVVQSQNLVQRMTTPLVVKGLQSMGFKFELHYTDTMASALQWFVEYSTRQQA